MANSIHPVPAILGPGAGAIKLRALENRTSPHNWAPETWWSQRVTAAQLVSLGTTTQISTITVSASGFTAGTVDIVFSGDGISTVTLSDIAIDTDEDTAAAAIESAIQTARATSLAGIVSGETVTANAVDVTFEDGIGWVDITVTFTPTQQTWDVVFAGTIADGNYDTTFAFTGYDPIVVRTTRAGGTPADEAALAVQHEADIEADVRLHGLIVSADDDATDTNNIIVEAGAPDLTITCSAPGSATLTPTETTGDTTITVVHNRDVSIDLNVAFPNNAVWSEVDRCWAGFYVIEAFDTNVTADLGDSGATTAVLSAVSLASTGWVSDTGNAQSDDYHESNWAPVLTVHFDDDDVTAGEVEVWVVLRKHETGTW